MKFKISRDHFSNGLQQVLNIVGTRSTRPILQNVLIEVKEDYVTLTTTNLDTGIRCQIKADVSTQGSITLPVRKLATIVRQLPKEEVLVEIGENNLAQINSGGSNFKIMGITAEEFPALPKFENRNTFELSQTAVVNMLKSVSYAQSNDENRYILNSVYFKFEDGKLTLVATDGRRLALTSIDLEIGDDDDVGNLILPAKTVAELERLVDKGEKLKISFDDRQVAFEINLDESGESGLVDHIYLVSKVVEGNYPNYEQVIPRETEHRVKVERELMLDCVNRAALVTSDKSNSVNLKMSKNLLEISASSPEYGESHESMAITYDGPEVQVSFNPNFLMEPLKALTKDEIFFEFKDHLSPGTFKTLDNFLCVVMPLRLN